MVTFPRRRAPAYYGRIQGVLTMSALSPLLLAPAAALVLLLLGFGANMVSIITAEWQDADADSKSPSP